MKRVLFMNPFIYLPGEKAIKRTFYLFEMMRKQGYEVCFLTSDFNHYEKKRRNTDKFYRKYPAYKECVQFVHMKPYKKNISVKRFLCNYQCEKEELKWFIENGRDYDIVYISWPTYYLVNHIRKYCDEYQVKLVIDVNDLWPDSLKMVFKNDLLYNMITWKMQRNTRQAFSYADGLVAVSKEYLAVAEKDNRRATEKQYVYIGSMLNKFDAGVRKYADEIKKPEDEFWLMYIGTLGASYDIDTVIRGVTELAKNANLDKKLRFKILGQGPEEAGLKKLTEELASDAVDFVGFVDYEHMAAYLSKTDICMNCLKLRAPQSIINKIADYFASGKPVLSSGPSEEMRSLIEDYSAGYHYEAENVDSLKEAVLKIYENPEEAKQMGEHGRMLAEEQFDRAASHQRIIDMLDRM